MLQAFHVSSVSSISTSPFSSIHGGPQLPIRALKKVIFCRVEDGSRCHFAVHETDEKQIPVFSSNQVIAKLHDSVRSSIHTLAYRAMYSSIVGGITTDPALMFVPIDDHMVHRGHGVFDTALIVNGYLYELDAHLDRILRSAAMARIVPPFSRATLKDILVQTVAASDCREGSLRYWLSAGPGGFSLSSRECKEASFYAIVMEGKKEINMEGVKVVTSTIPIKPPQFASMKNVNYLPNALAIMEAEDHGAVAGIWLDDEGFIAEGPNMNVAFVSQDSILLVPSFDKILSGCTAKRILDLAPGLFSQKGNKLTDVMLDANQHAPLLKDIRVGQITVAEAKDAAEMMLIGSGVLVKPVVQWDEKPIGNGKPGPVTLALMDLLRKDMINSPATQRIRVPYK